MGFGDLFPEVVGDRWIEKTVTKQCKRAHNDVAEGGDALGPMLDVRCRG